MQNKRRWLPSWQRVELVELCLEQGLSRREAAAWRRVSVSTVQFWIERYRHAPEDQRASGAWAADRPSTPHRQPARVDEATHDRVCEARQRTGWGPRLIASELGMSHATVSRCLQRRGLSRMAPREHEEVRRYEWPCPGDLLQMDTKQFANFSRPGHAVTGDRHRTGAEKRMKVGKQFAHSMIDDHSRLASTELHRDERAPTVTAFLQRALAFFAGHGVQPKRLQTDNARAYIHNTSLARLVADRGIQHAGSRRARRSKRQGRALPADPQTRMDARTELQELSRPRRRLDAWLMHYNFTRNHSSLDNRPPITRVQNELRHEQLGPAGGHRRVQPLLEGRAGELGVRPGQGRPVRVALAVGV